MSSNVDVLILTILTGMGHLHAAYAIKEGLHRLYPQLCTRIVLPLECIHPFVSDFLNRFYLRFVRFFPLLWEMFYRASAVVPRLNPIYWFITLAFVYCCKKALRERSPKVIVCTHPFPTAAVAYLKRRGFVESRLISVCTDFDVHPFAIDGAVDLFIVPSKSVAEERRLDERKVRDHGIPIHPKFLRKNNKKREKILVLGGGYGIGPIKKLASLQNLDISNKLCIIVGKNEKLRRKLQKKLSLKGIEVLGFIHNLDELLEEALFIVTKPGGLTVSEALAKGVPVVILSAVKGQETMNAKYLVENNAGVWPKRKELLHCIKNLAEEKGLLHTLYEGAERIGRPSSSYQIAKTIFEYALEEGG
jgi:processive 1,2-diacylglycerol beta-glucosyltransferase